MSHEIRTPINAVLGMDEMILRESIDSKISEYASDVRILVVDDNEMNLKAFLGLLKKHGMQIDTAMSGKECLARMEKYNEKDFDHRWNNICQQVCCTVFFIV